jgi:protein gp37
MAARTGIEWTQVTWNPTTGCDRISAGCDHCYALALAKRLKAMGQPKYQADGDIRTSGPGFGISTHADALQVPYTWPGRRVVFVNSMSDLFHARVPLAFVRQVFAVITDTPQHTYQVLTKRSARLRKFAPLLDWPPNLWMGVSVEDAAALYRVNDLRRVPAAVRFLSCEPLLGPLDALDLSGIEWVIAGGESGPECRPVDPAWVAAIRDRCSADQVPFFFKQWGGKTPKAGGWELDGRIWHQMPPVPALAAASVRPDHAVANTAGWPDDDQLAPGFEGSGRRGN